MSSGIRRLLLAVVLLVASGVAGDPPLGAADCNGNGAEDRADITGGVSIDCNANNIPDECDGAPVDFNSVTSLPAGGGGIALVDADFDGDGLADLAVGHKPPQSGDRTDGITVLLNRGAGEVESTNHVTDAPVVAVTSGDLDGDGDLDIAATGDAVIWVLLNHGDGSFGDVLQRPAPTGTSAVATADMNRDGVDDIVVTNTDVDSVSVLLGNGDGTFGEPTDQPVGTDPRAIVTADLDGDGDPDVATANRRAKNLSVFFNDGVGSLGPVTTLDGGGDGVAYLVAVDLDGDLLVDLAALGRSALVVFLGQEGASFSDPVRFETRRRTPSGLDFADVDGNGTTDLVGSFLGPRGIFAFLATGGGDFSHAASVRMELSVSALKLVDLDGDGDRDLAVTLADLPTISLLWIGETRGGRLVSMSEREKIHLGEEPHYGALVDLDGDGDVDLAINDGGRTVYLYTNEGGELSGPVTRPISSTSALFHMVATDVDVDGDVDLVIAADSTSEVNLLVNDGQGHFPTARRFPVGSAPYAVAAGDLNNDGLPDLATPDRGSNSVSVLLNEGNTNFRAEPRITGFGEPISTAIGDFDADGDADIAVVSPGTAAVAVLLNDGNGTFAERVNYRMAQPRYVTGVDFDNDGDLDLTAVSLSPRRLLLLETIPGGPPVLARTVSLRFSPFMALPVDVDGDGLIDFVTANRSTTISVLLQQDNGGFAPIFDLGVGQDPRVVFAGDLDGDGDPDLISANHSSFDLTVIENHSETVRARPFLERICTRADFYEVSAPVSFGGNVKRLVKYIVPADPGDPTLLPPVFQNTSQHPLHQDFLAEVFGDRFVELDRDTYSRLVERRATRKYFIGVLFELATDDGPLYGFNVLAAYFSDAAELPTIEEVRAVRETLREVFTLEPLAYFPDRGPAREAARAWPDTGFPIHLDEPSLGFSYEAYTQGVAYGYVRRLTQGQFEELNERGFIGFRDILVLERSPRDIEGIPAAVITAEPQGELSHVAVRAARRGTPNAFVADALDAFSDLDGKLIRLDVRRDGLDTGEAPIEVAAAWWEAARPTLPDLPPVDPIHAALDSLAEMDLDGPVPPESRHGGKAANLARLQTVVDPEYQEVGFAIPVHYYLEFMQQNTVPSAVDPARMVSFDDLLDELFGLEEFRKNPEFRFAALRLFRETVRGAGEVNPDLVDALHARIEAIFGSTTRMVRFRSSSNVEDGLEFNGAGLYDSTSSCAADLLDQDDSGPSLCDPTKENERTVERALKKVWASLWTFRAFEERAYYSIPQKSAAMGILVSRAFPDEIANGVAFTGNPSDHLDSRYVIIVQVGEESVVSPEPGAFAEKNLLRVENGQVVEIIRAASSTLVPLGATVLSDSQLRELGELMWIVQRDFPINPAEHVREDILLDLEFKIEPGGDLAVKQVRPFLKNTASELSPVFELEIPPGTMACGVFAPSVPPGRLHELKSTLRFRAGRIPLPTRRRSFDAELYEEVLLGPDRQPAEAVGPGTFRVIPERVGERVRYEFVHEQSFTLANGESYDLTLRLADESAFESVDGEPVEAVRVFDEEFLTRGLSLQGQTESVVTYSSCTYETLPLWEISFELEDGSSAWFLERHEPPQDANSTGPAALLSASLDLRGVTRSSVEYWDLVYSSTRHNRNIVYRVTFDEPIVIKSLPRPFWGVDVVAPEPLFGVSARLDYLDESFDVIASTAAVASSRKLAGASLDTTFVRGDVQADGANDLTDAAVLLEHLFGRGAAPPCRKAADANDDGQLNVTDAIHILLSLFVDGRSFPAPADACGNDLTRDGLTCESFAVCE